MEESAFMSTLEVSRSTERWIGSTKDGSSKSSWVCNSEESEGIGESDFFSIGFGFISDDVLCFLFFEPFDDDFDDRLRFL